MFLKCDLGVDASMSAKSKKRSLDEGEDGVKDESTFCGCGPLPKSASRPFGKPYPCGQVIAAVVESIMKESNSPFCPLMDDELVRQCIAAELFSMENVLRIRRELQKTKWSFDYSNQALLTTTQDKISWETTCNGSFRFVSHSNIF